MYCMDRKKILLIQFEINYYEHHFLITKEQLQCVVHIGKNGIVSFLSMRENTLEN